MIRDLGLMPNLFVHNTTFNNISYIVAVSFNGGAKMGTKRKTPIRHTSLTNFIAYNLYSVYIWSHCIGGEPE
jgi:hypothetical protein